jgi:hypothetical protein
MKRDGRAQGMAQVVEHLPSMLKDLATIPSATKNEIRRKGEKNRRRRRKRKKVVCRACRKLQKCNYNASHNEYRIIRPFEKHLLV